MFPNEILGLSFCRVHTNPSHHNELDSDSDSDSDRSQSGSGSNSTRRHSDLSDSIFRSYLDFTGKTSATSADLAKIQSFLTSSSSSALSCLICLERIRPADPTWSCGAACFSVFHLICIQSWARQVSALSTLRASTRLPISDSKAAELASRWNCPKCRSEYGEAQIPKTYRCFCGKVENPASDPWILPHSCGEVCDRPLRHECGHRCLLLCHPGPCPSCPKLVEANCFCGNTKDMRRCSFKTFSCNNVCRKMLKCGDHHCLETCHDGECRECRVRAMCKCRCGRKTEEKACCERLGFRCEEECGEMLGCGEHRCERGCHSGECGGCPLEGKRSCPCGKRVYEGLSCKDVVAVCGGTCEKVLSCGYHRCPERCHRGECVETCRTVVNKWCRCGGLKKEVPCHQVLTCERKCQRLRDCGRHACKRRCCDGDCPPCSEVCDRKLRCKNHKCPSPCHRGVCAPCPVMVTIACLCGATHFEVPCGTEKDQKPPRCHKPCPVSPLCRHGPNSKPHKCHYGARHPCKLLCEEEYPCGHTCKLRCHGPKPPPNPEFTLKPKKKKHFHPPECTPGSPCPPCSELVWRSCVGQHFAADRMMVCSDKSLFSCDNLCGNPLPCGNHFCTKSCHPLKNQSLPSGQQARSEPCEVCHLPCEKERTPACIHPCPLSCHPGDCPPCKVLIKRSCHCGSMVHVFECLYYNSLSEMEQMAVRSCKGLCHRKLPYCTHLCPETCHPGQCPSPEKCSKKVTVRCGCQTLKREWLCHDVQAAYHNTGADPKDITKNQFGHGLLPCDSNCKSKQKTVDSELHLRRPKVVEVKESDTDKPVSKKKRRRERGQEAPQISTLQKVLAHVKRILLVVILLVLLVAGSYYGYKGLLQLSDWMNEVEEKRQRRHLRI